MKLDRATQQKVLEMAGVQAPPEERKEKYHNRRVVTADGLKFDSRAEYRRWLVLKAQEEMGDIANLQRQVRFPLIVNGVKVGTYTADFVYLDMVSPVTVPDGRIVVEDKKGYRDARYKFRKRVFEACTGHQLRET